MSLGFRIVAMPLRPSKALVAGLAEMATPNLSDVMGGVQGSGGELKPMHRGAGTAAQKMMCGPAFTVKTAPGNNLMLQKALNIAEPGDVIVVDAGGTIDRAIMGEIIARYAVSRGLGGIVIDGAIRDAAALSDSDFPVFARGIVHKGPYRDGPGQIGVPVSIGGMVVVPGDIIVGDADGLVAVGQHEAEAVLEAARHTRALEEVTMKAIDDGKLDRSWVDAALRAKGFTA
jgi:regulator of RNase E activity RraA